MIDTQKFAFLTLKLAVFHRVYNHRKAEKMEPMLSGKVVKFNDQDIYKGKFLKEELIKAIRDSGRTISFKEDSPKANTTPTIVKELFTVLEDPSINDIQKDNLFLEKSRWFATKLDSFHTGVIPGGILAILYGHFSVPSDEAEMKNNKQILVIAKIEEATALQVIEDEKTSDLDIQLVEKLIMLHNANVMKAGVFYNG